MQALTDEIRSVPAIIRNDEGGSPRTNEQDHGCVAVQLSGPYAAPSVTRPTTDVQLPRDDIILKQEVCSCSDTPMSLSCGLKLESLRTLRFGGGKRPALFVELKYDTCLRNTATRISALIFSFERQHRLPLRYILFLFPRGDSPGRVPPQHSRVRSGTTAPRR